MKTPASQMFGEAMGRVLAKGGTPEGARRGWETRRGRAPVEDNPPKERPKPPEKPASGPDYETAQSFMDIGKKHPDVPFFIMPQQDGTIELVVITVPEGERSKGKGSAVMRDLTAHADSKGVTLTLKVAEAAEVGEKNRARLFEFYKRFGFILNEGKYNERSSDMYREPVGKPEKPISKDGTTEGAIRGWETRRRGGPPLIPVVRHFSDARDKIKSLIRESVDELEQEIENNRKRIPSDYMGMIRRDEARRRQGYELVREAAQRLAGIQPHPGDAEKRAMLLRYAEQEAERVSQRDGEKTWDEEFSDYLTEAGAIAARAVSQVH